MGRNARPTQAKRAREKDLLERRQMKEQRRREVKEQKASAPAPPPGIDPDLEGITPGPQPLANWQVEMLEEDDEQPGEADD